MARPSPVSKLHIGTNGLEIMLSYHQDTWSCVSGQENKRCMTHRCVIYWYHKVAKFSLLQLQIPCQFLIYLYIFCLTCKLLQETASAFLEIFVPENCPIFFIISCSLHKITNIVKSMLKQPINTARHEHMCQLQKDYQKDGALHL